MLAEIRGIQNQLRTKRTNLDGLTIDELNEQNAKDTQRLIQDNEERASLLTEQQKQVVDLRTRIVNAVNELLAK